MLLLITKKKSYFIKVFLQNIVINTKSLQLLAISYLYQQLLIV